MDKYLGIKNFSCKKVLIDKLLFACGDEIINTLETLLDDEKYRSSIGNYTTLIITYRFSCYYYYIRDWIKKNTHYHILKKLNSVK